MRRFSTRARAAIGLALGMAITVSASAQNWPVKQLRMVIPFTPGSGTDVVGRAVAERLGAALGHPIIVENRPGAGGTIGAGIVAKAEPDGYTILVQSSSHTVNPLTYSNLSYDTLRDLSAVTPLAALPNVLIIAPARGIRSVAELVAAAKAKPDSFNYASAGQGSATHLNAERFRLAGGFQGTHVPYKGTPEAVTDVIAGRVDYYFCPVVSAIPQIKDGRVLALAVGSPRRSSALPDLPTTLEAGLANSDYTFWVGMFVPSKTPREIVNRLYQETAKVLAAPELRKRLSDMGAEPMAMSPDQFDKYVADEIRSNAILVKAAGVKGN